MKPQTLTLFNEQWLMKRLREQGCGLLDAGVTTAEQRRENVRQAILQIGANIIAGRGRDGKSITYEQAWERLYNLLFRSGLG